MTNLVNLTPHSITLYNSQGIKEIEPSGQLARVRYQSAAVGELEGAVVFRAEYEEVSGLPDPEPDTVFIVSSMILSALKARNEPRRDLVAPATGPNDGAIRDPRGRIVGITKWVVL
jgi:hypothetical protein